MRYEAASMRTRRALAESLKKLMRQKPFSKITVTEIVADCGVNRKTFYYHFEDIYALLRWIFEEEADKIMHEFDLLEQPEEAMGYVLDYVSENREMLSSACAAFGSVEIENFFLAGFTGMTNTVVLQSEEKMSRVLPDRLRDYLCKFLAEAVCGMLMSLINGMEPLERQRMIDYSTLIIRTAIRGLISDRGVPAGT